MKILHLSIFSGFVILLTSVSLMTSDDNTVHGLTYQEALQNPTPPGYTIVSSNTTEWFLWHNHYLDILNYSDSIFTGNITSKNILNVTSFYTIGNITSSRIFLEGSEYVTRPPYKKINYTLNLDQYTIDVDEFLKNPQRSNKMTIREPITDPTWHSDPDGPRFNVGDHVLFYVKNLDGTPVYSQMSFKIPNTCNATDVLTQKRIGSVFMMTQNGVQVDYNKHVENINNFTANKPIQFTYGEAADTLSGKDFVVKNDIVEDPAYGVVFSKEFNFSSKKCEWIGTTQWELSLKKGNYYSNTYIKNTDGIFAQKYSVGFSVKQDTITASPPSSNPNSEKILTSTKAPEFPFVIPVLLISITLLILFYRWKIKINRV